MAGTAWAAHPNAAGDGAMLKNRDLAEVVRATAYFLWEQDGRPGRPGDGLLAEGKGYAPAPVGL